MDVTFAHLYPSIHLGQLLRQVTGSLPVRPQSVPGRGDRQPFETPGSSSLQRAQPPVALGDVNTLPRNGFNSRVERRAWNSWTQHSKGFWVCPHRPLLCKMQHVTPSSDRSLFRQRHGQLSVVKTWGHLDRTQKFKTRRVRNWIIDHTHNWRMTFLDTFLAWDKLLLQVYLGAELPSLVQVDYSRNM